MTASEIKTKQEELEYVITNLLNNFGDETMQLPITLDIYLITAFGGRKQMISGVKIITEDNEYPIGA